eukprot:EG_transcript_42499
MSPQELEELASDVQAHQEAVAALRERCVATLDALDKQDLHELKRFAKPPALVRLVTDAVSLLLVGRTGWEVTQRLLADSKFLPALAAYDPRRVPLRTHEDLQDWVDHPHFRPELVR